MAKAPHRPVRKPAAGGALPRRVQTKNSQGRFCKADDPDAVIFPVAAKDVATAGPSTVTPSIERRSPVRAVRRTPSAAPRKRTSRTTSSSAKLVARLMRTIERELSRLEEILSGVRVSSAQRSEAEKCTRSLMSLTRTLADMTKLDTTREARADHDDEALPRDLDDFRRTLERRLAQMADGGSHETDGNDERGGDGVA